MLPATPSAMRATSCACSGSRLNSVLWSTGFIDLPQPCEMASGLLLPAEVKEVLDDLLLGMGNLQHGKHGRQLAAVMRLVVGDVHQHLPQQDMICLPGEIAVGDLILQTCLRLPVDEGSHFPFHLFPPDL